MKAFSALVLPALLAGTSLSPAFAQEVPPPADQPPAEEEAPEEEEEEEALDPDDPYADEYEDDSAEIIVTGARERGAVLGDIPPEIQLNRRDIRAYGAGNLGELLEALAPQTRSGRGRGEGGGPVVLLNGRRISGFSEIRGIPPEAIERVDILPEEVALRYGYRADQRVVNFVLRPRFRAITGEVEYGFPTAGGRSSYEADLNILRLNRNGRWSVDMEFERDGALLESERDLIQSAPSRPFDLIGNIGAAPFAPGAEIDPALSAAAGELVTVAGVPVSATLGAPALGDFTAGANVPDLGRFRTLLPETESLSLNGTLNRTIFDDISATFNARLGLNGSESRLGLPSATYLIPADNPFSPFGSDVTLFRYERAWGPLGRRSDGRTAHLGLSLNGDILPWRWSFTANYDNNRNTSRTDTGIDPASVQARIDAGDPSLNPFEPLNQQLAMRREQDRSRSTSQSADAQAVASGPLFRLPGGPVSASLRLGVDTRHLGSETFRGGVLQERDLARERAAFQGSVDVPIASRRRDVLSPIGDLSANFNLELEHLSDFGTLRTLGGGVRWSPIEAIDLIASYTDEDGAPSMQQLGDPVVLIPNVRVFDFSRGETVDISRLEGGNPDLIADNRRVVNLRLQVRPLSEKDLTFTAAYTSSRTRNPIASFPTATPEIEAAFPERFVRDADGQLLRIDSRPVNFARADRSQLRWGVNFAKSLGPQPDPAARQAWRERMRQARAGGATPGQTSPTAGETPRGPREGRGAGGRRGGGGPGGGGRGFGGGRGGFGGFGGGGRGGRLQLSLYHTWHFQDEILIRPGVPELDLLGGSAVGSRGGRPRHEIEGRVGVFRNGFGGQVTANWQSGTFVRGGPDGRGGTSGDLFFSDLATVNLRLFADLNQQRSLVRRHPFLRGTRVTLSVNNLFDSRLGVRDETGFTPLSYQPDYLDPLGRSVRIGIRKLFF